jgi:hypothetical protein
VCELGSSSGWFCISLSPPAPEARPTSRVAQVCN